MAGAGAGATKKKQKPSISPYMSFCKTKTNRDKAKELHPDVPILKALSFLWKSLSDHEKSVYSNNDNSNASMHQISAQEDAEIPQDKGAEEEENGLELPFPLARVKRIIKHDKDIKQAANEPSLLIAFATQSFLQLLTESAWAVASEKKRKSVRFEDIVTAISRQRRFADFLEDSLSTLRRSQGQNDHDNDEEDEDEKDEATGVAKEKASVKCSNKCTKPPPAGTRTITHFFGRSKDSDPL